MSDEMESGYAEGWRPDPGDTVSGKVVDIAATDLGQGVYPVVTLRNASGDETAVHAFHGVLRKELARRRPKLGDELEITYVGKKASGGYGDKGYHVYRVRSDNDVVGYNWDQDLPEEERGDVPVADVPIAHEPPPAAEPEPEPVTVPADDEDDIPF